MATERLDWQAAPDLATANIRLKRAMEIIDAGIRVSSGSLGPGNLLLLTQPRTVVQVDSSAAPVALVLPKASSVPGYQVEVIVIPGGWPVTVTATVPDLIDGQVDVQTATTVTLNSLALNWVES